MNTTKTILSAGGVLIVAVIGIGIAISKNDSPQPTPAATASPASITHLAPADAQALITAHAGDPSFEVLDVRTASEYATGHLAGAANLDYYAADVRDQVAALDHAKTYLVYCHTGNRSGKVTAMMQSMGFAHVNDLSGGMSAWQGASLPVE